MNVQHTSKAAIRGGLQRTLVRHRPVTDDIPPPEEYCAKCGEYWPCEVFRSALLNLQIQGLFDIFTLILSAQGRQSVAEIIGRLQNGSPQESQGR